MSRASLRAVVLKTVVRQHSTSSPINLMLITVAENCRAEEMNDDVLL
jgi:hypothetical protein